VRSADVLKWRSLLVPINEKTAEDYPKAELQNDTLPKTLCLDTPSEQQFNRPTAER
jgi:hypothetical protein